MKLACVLAVILGVFTCKTGAQICASAEICPLDFPVRSDGGGACNSPEGDTVRNEIWQGLTNLLSANSQVLNTLHSKYLGLSPEAPAASCAEIYRKDPLQASAASGHYFVGGSERSYCEFNFNTPGEFDQYGWQRLALTDMTDPQTSCPSGLNLMESGGVRFCTKNPNPNAGSCQSLYYQPTSLVKRMYGRIYGIQIGTPDVRDNAGGINDAYVDGVSLTYGNAGSRSHIWTFYCTLTDTNNDCPCSSNPARTTPDFVRDNYFCESGTSETDNFGTYVNDPLWDAANCLLDQAPCCNTGPWFYREFDVPFGDRVELRICTDEGTSNEDIGVQLIELYFQ